MTVASRRVLVVGATGLIGRAVTAGLMAAGYRVVGMALRTTRAARAMPAVEWISFDVAAATQPEDWLPHLSGIDAVVNCAGVLQDSLRDSTHGVHVAGTGALFAACERAGPRRVVHVSAIGIDHRAPSRFSRTKREADEALTRRDLDWVILRPAIVVGTTAYGGSAMFRALAAWPVLPVVPDTGTLRVVQLDDLLATVLFFLSSQAPTRLVLDLAGPERFSFVELVGQYRRWLGWREAATVKIPRSAAALLYWLGDIAAILDWRAPLRSTTRLELSRGADGDPGRWSEITGIAPQSLAATLAARPASVQERWFAGLYLLKPLIFAGLSLFWVVTGIVALGPGYATAVRFMAAVGAGALSAPAAIAGSVVDILIGVGIAVRRTSRIALFASLGVSAAYLIVATLLLPALWADPLGPLVKVWPTILLAAVALAILEDR
jgi:uncharacterized protein YbjT (DUF2867 family)